MLYQLFKARKSKWVEICKKYTGSQDEEEKKFAEELKTELGRYILEDDGHMCVVKLNTDYQKFFDQGDAH